MSNELLQKIRSSKQGKTFNSLFDGKTSLNHSSADLALCNILAFWTGKDANKMDSIFRQSGLMRPKWDETHNSAGETYGQMTISKAIDGCNEVYDTKYNSHSAPKKYTIKVISGTLPQQIDEAEDALLKSGIELYQRSRRNNPSSAIELFSR